MFSQISVESESKMMNSMTAATALGKSSKKMKAEKKHKTQNQI